MRRFFYWQLPMAASLAAIILFGYGFGQFLAVNRGTPVDVPVPSTPAAARKSEQIAALILGDSLARGTGDETGLGIGGRLDQELKRLALPARRTWNLGVNGARSADLLLTLESANVQQLLRESNVVIVSIGGNDLWGGSNWRNAAPPDPDAVMDDVLDRIGKVIERVRAANPGARIFFVGLYNPFVRTPAGPSLTPMVNRWNARLVDKFGGDPDFTLVPTADLFSHHDRLSLDRFHPGGEGYGLIARRIAEAL